MLDLASIKKALASTARGFQYRRVIKGGVYRTAKDDLAAAVAEIEGLRSAPIATAGPETAAPRDLQPLAMKTALTVVMSEDDGAAQADCDLAAIQGGSQILRTQAPEMYFHQLRLRVAQEPDLARSIAVVYQRANGELLPVGLMYEDELRWPVGFLQATWEKETQIQAIRRPPALSGVASQEPTLRIILNGRTVLVGEPRGLFPTSAGEVSYEDLVEWAGHGGGPARILSVTYSTRRASDEQRQGSLSPGRSTPIEDGMIFNVADTSNA